jgi:hypothetical protein
LQIFNLFTNGLTKPAIHAAVCSVGFINTVQRGCSKAKNKAIFRQKEKKRGGKEKKKGEKMGCPTSRHTDWLADRPSVVK